MSTFDFTVKTLRQQGLNSDEILEELSKLFNEGKYNMQELENEGSKEYRIRKALKILGVPCHLKGYECWEIAIQIYKKNKMKKKFSMTKEIYPQIAEILEVSPSIVERRMRIAVDKAFERCPEEVIQEIFGNSYSHKKHKPTNVEFLTALAEQI